MSTQTGQFTAAASESSEVRAARRAVPVWLMILFFVLLYWGFIYFDQRSGWAEPQVYAPYHSLAEVSALNLELAQGNQLYERGRAVFESNCALCHNSDGMGKPNQAPPFVGSEWVLGSALRMIRIPQNGLSGPIPLKSAVWNQAPSMPAMGAALSDDDLASVLTYIRQSWGNKASDVTPEQVKAVRTEVANHPQMWTADELSKIE